VKEIQKLRREAGTDAELCLEAGDVSKIVRGEALRHAADLVIIGRGHIQETLGRLRTHEHVIIRESPCPVLSICPGRLPVTASEADFFSDTVPVALTTS